MVSKESEMDVRGNRDFGGGDRCAGSAQLVLRFDLNGNGRLHLLVKPPVGRRLGRRPGF